MKVVYRLFCRHFARRCSPNVSSPFEDGNGTRFQLHLQNGGGAANPAGLPPGILLRKCKSNPIPYPGLEINEQSWQIPRHARVSPRGYPPSPRMTADKCIMHYHYALSVCNVSVKSKFQHAPPPGIPRAFDTFAVPGRREFDYQSLSGGGEFDPHALGVGNLNCTLDFM